MQDEAGQRGTRSIVGTVPTPAANLLLGSFFGGEKKWHDNEWTGRLSLADDIFKAKEECRGYIFPSAIR